MITINDEQRLLNLNHMAIYLMLSSDEIARYGEKLKVLNRYTTLTRGLFHFDIVEKGDNPYEALPADMIRNMRHFNVMVRLVNSIHGIYCYGMEEIYLDSEISVLIDELKSFVDSVCKEDIKQLDILSERPTSTSMAAMKMYRDNNIVKEIFEAALDGEDVDTAKAKALLEKTSLSSDMETSLGLASAALDDKQVSKIEKERCEREKPFEKPDITLTVKYVKTGKFFKNGREQKKLGIEMNINGDIVPVWFGTTDQTFLYIATLMAILEDRSLKRSNFQPLQTVKSEIVNKQMQKERQEFKIWLQNRFRALQFDRNFEEWYVGVKEDPHPLDVAMGVIKKKLWDFLRLQYKDAYYYSFVVNENGHYKVRINKNHIKIDPVIIERIANI